MSTNGHAVLGIDVDLDGARDGCWMVRDMPTVDDGKRHRREINSAAIRALLREQAPTKDAYIEHAAAMPRQGVASMFNLAARSARCRWRSSSPTFPTRSSHRKRRSKGCGARPAIPCSGAHELTPHRPMAGRRCAAILIGLA
jgi:hypothetical protein